jgi:guanylate kinase
MGKIIIITGPSGAGKTTLGSILVESDNRFVKVITATNRSPREGEVNGKDYYFMTTEEFKQKIKEDFFVEYEEVYSNRFYGSPKIELESIWNQEKIPVSIVDVKGAQTLAAIYDRNAYVVNLVCPDLQTSYNRLLSRDGEVDSERLNKIQKEENFGQIIKSVTVVNNQLDVAAEELIRHVLSFIFLNKMENI